MPKAFKIGCVRPESEIENDNAVKKDEDAILEKTSYKKGEENMIKVGKAAPDFELSGYHNGEFKQFQLSEFKDKWLLLCFYPGDFTFV